VHRSFGQQRQDRPAECAAPGAVAAVTVALGGAMVVIEVDLLVQLVKGGDSSTHVSTPFIYIDAVTIYRYFAIDNPGSR
jgi:hypothetical protein